MASWESWVKDQLVDTGKVTKAAIIGLDKLGIWASFPEDFKVKKKDEKEKKAEKEELEIIRDILNDPAVAKEKQVFVNGLYFLKQKYKAVNINEDGIFVMNGRTGLSIAKSDAMKCIVIGYFDENCVANNANDVVKKVAEMLTEEKLKEEQNAEGADRTEKK